MLMRPVGHKITPFSLLILVWLIPWVTTVPLFHTHLPDATDEPAFRQGGLAHTVFSPDLPGEFSRSFDVTDQDHFTHVSNRVSNSPELGFALLEEDSKKDRMLGPQIVISILWCLPNKPLLPNSTIESHPKHLRLLLSTAPQGPRAPPSVFFL